MHTPSSVRSPKQLITLSGLNLPLFTENLNGLHALRNILTAHLGEDTVSKLSLHSLAGFPTIQISNRYFSSQEEAQEYDVQVLSEDIDPCDELDKIGRQHGLVHTQDNVVEYWEQRLQGDGTK